MLFFFNDTATTEIYTLSLHDALPISPGGGPAAARGLHAGGARGEALPHRQPPAAGRGAPPGRGGARAGRAGVPGRDRKSTRLNSRHSNNSYAAFFLIKKKNNMHTNTS